MRDFVDSFYEAVSLNGCVTLEDFTGFMDFLATIRQADTEEVESILTYAFMRSAEIRNALEERQLACDVRGIRRNE